MWETNLIYFPRVHFPENRPYLRLVDKIRETGSVSDWVSHELSIFAIEVLDGASKWLTQSPGKDSLKTDFTVNLSKMTVFRFTKFTKLRLHHFWYTLYSDMNLKEGNQGDNFSPSVQLYIYIYIYNSIRITLSVDCILSRWVRSKRQWEGSEYNTKVHPVEWNQF